MKAPAARLIAVIPFALAALAAAATERVSVAAAANLTYVLDPLDRAFCAVHPDASVETTVGSSGNLVAMITQGAPYDVFLSADLDFPKKLIASGGAVRGTLVPFAYGRLVLWTTRPSLGLTSIEAVVRDPSVRKIAVANPRTAPYGRAAEEALSHLGLANLAAPKIVFAENISQTAQFVSSGNADAGFVALALVASPNLKAKGRWLEVPADAYAPIAQGAVLTLHGSANASARHYLEFLRGKEARVILKTFGYGLP